MSTTTKLTSMSVEFAHAHFSDILPQPTAPLRVITDQCLFLVNDLTNLSIGFSNITNKIVAVARLNR